MNEPLKDRVARLKTLKADISENEMLMKVAEESQDFSMIPLLFEQLTSLKKEIDSLQKGLTIQLIARFFQELGQNTVSIFEVTGFHAEQQIIIARRVFDANNILLDQKSGFQSKDFEAGDFFKNNTIVG